MSAKKMIVKLLGKQILGFLSDFIEMVADVDVIENWLIANPEFLKVMLAGAEWADRMMGEDEDQTEEKIVDELKEAIFEVASNLGIDLQFDLPEDE